MPAKQRSRFLSRFLALFLSLSLIVPNPALALREIQTVDSGFEERELAHALRGTPVGIQPDTLLRSAGLEEGVMNIEVRNAFGQIWAQWNPQEDLGHQSIEFKTAREKLGELGFSQILDIGPVEPSSRGSALIQYRELEIRPGSDKLLEAILQKAIQSRHDDFPLANQGKVAFLLENVSHHVPDRRALVWYSQNSMEWVVMDRGPGVLSDGQHPQLLKAIQGGQSLTDRGGGWGLTDALNNSQGGSEIWSNGYWITHVPNYAPSSLMRLSNALEGIHGTVVYLRVLPPGPTAGLEEKIVQKQTGGAEETVLLRTGKEVPRADFEGVTAIMKELRRSHPEARGALIRFVKGVRNEDELWQRSGPTLSGNGLVKLDLGSSSRKLYYVVYSVVHAIIDASFAFSHGGVAGHGVTIPVQPLAFPPPTYWDLVMKLFGFSKPTNGEPQFRTDRYYLDKYVSELKNQKRSNTHAGLEEAGRFREGAIQRAVDHLQKNWPNYPEIAAAADRFLRGEINFQEAVGIVAQQNVWNLKEESDSTRQLLTIAFITAKYGLFELGSSAIVAALTGGTTDEKIVNYLLNDNNTRTRPQALEIIRETRTFVKGPESASSPPAAGLEEGENRAIAFAQLLSLMDRFRRQSDLEFREAVPPTTGLVIDLSSHLEEAIAALYLPKGSRVLINPNALMKAEQLTGRTATERGLRLFYVRNDNDFSVQANRAIGSFQGVESVGIFSTKPEDQVKAAVGIGDRDIVVYVRGNLTLEELLINVGVVWNQGLKNFLEKIQQAADYGRYL